MSAVSGVCFLHVFPTFISYFLGKPSRSFIDPCSALGYALARRSHSAGMEAPFSSPRSSLRDRKNDAGGARRWLKVVVPVQPLVGKA